MKKLYLIICGVFFGLLCLNEVDAATANIKVTSNNSTVIVGDTVNVTIEVSSSSNLGSWTFDVVPSSNLTYVSSSFSGGMYIRDVVDSSSQKSKTYTFKFKAKSSGTASVSIKNATVYGYDETKMSVNTGSKKFTLMTNAELQATYSKNNYLSSLEVENHSFKQKFDKEILEYEIELENGTESIKVLTTKDDSKSTVKGGGIINLKEGLNVIEITVTAQNGSIRTYKINAIVKELSPIEIKIDNLTYNVIRKKELMPTASIYYEETTVKINDEEVPAYFNEATNFTLVGLTDKSLKSKLYIYDNGNFAPYDEVTFNSISLYFKEVDNQKIPKGYIATKLDFGSYSVTGYAKEGYEYPLIYGMNIETGEENFYKYDKEEKTIQRLENISDNTLDIYFYIIIGLFSFIILIFIIFLIILISKNKKVKKIKKNIINS